MIWQSSLDDFLAVQLLYLIIKSAWAVLLGYIVFISLACRAFVTNSKNARRTHFRLDDLGHQNIPRTLPSWAISTLAKLRSGTYAQLVSGAHLPLLFLSLFMALTPTNSFRRGTHILSFSLPTPPVSYGSSSVYHFPLPHHLRCCERA